MKKLILLLLMVSTQAHALEAVVTVLEAPMFKEKDIDSPVVQYARKGDVIKLHPSLANTTQYDHMAPYPEKYEEMRKKAASSPEWRDPLFKGEENRTVYLEDEFIPAMDRQGNVVYVLSEHVYVYFNDTRELKQKVGAKDPTDYRLQEPLPKRYPLPTPAGYRGQVLLGFSQPYNESYAYPDPVKTKGYSNPLEVNLGMLWHVPHQKQDRFYFGANLHFKSFENSYTFFDSRSAREKYFIFGLGPLIAYDAFKGERNRINLSGSIDFHPYNFLTVTQTRNGVSDTRNYRSFNFSPKVSIQYHRKSILENLDFVLGTSMVMETQSTYHAKDGGSEPGWWSNLGTDQFTTRNTFTLSAFLGLQAAY